MKTTFLHLTRSFKYGFQNFGRNVFLSVATTSVMVLTLFGVGFLMVLNQLSSDAINTIQEKIDISVYIKDDADQTQINEFIGYLRNVDQVQAVDVLTKEEALERFKEDFQDNPEILNSLEVIEVNPLPVTVILQAEDTSTYGEIVEQIKSHVPESRSEIEFVPDRKAHDRRYAMDASKLERELGWKPKHTFEEALPKTIEWYLANREWVENCRSKI